MDMDTTNSTDSGMMMMGMMTPFFHFTGGDYLLFKAWMPTSAGAIAGACVGLFVFAIFERWVHATSPALVHRLKQRYPSQYFLSSQWATISENISARASPKAQHLNKPLEDEASVLRRSSDSAETSSIKKKRTLPPRTTPPFVASVDIPRGIIYAFQRLLGFAMMLAIMYERS